MRTLSTGFLLRVRDLAISAVPPTLSTPLLDKITGRGYKIYALVANAAEIGRLSALQRLLDPPFVALSRRGAVNSWISRKDRSALASTVLQLLSHLLRVRPGRQLRRCPGVSVSGTPGAVSPPLLVLSPVPAFRNEGEALGYLWWGRTDGGLFSHCVGQTAEAERGSA
jgi:hypothetical protein